VAPTSAWFLVMVDGGAGSISYALTEQGVQIGRSKDCDIPLSSQNVSRNHARVFIYQGRPFVQDLGSRNGVFVNGGRIQQQELVAGDTLNMGEFTFLISTDPEPITKAHHSNKLIVYAIGGLVLLALIVATIAKLNSTDPDTNVAVLKENAIETSSEVENMFDTFGKTARIDKTTGVQANRNPVEPRGAQEAPARMASDKRSIAVRDYLDRAELLQEAGKLTEALGQYQRALKLDPSCVLCKTRKERLRKEIVAKINRLLEDGMKNFGALRYQRAIDSWELVKNLSPDPGSQPYQLANKYIADAEAKLATQQRF